ncbi:hypothetical protein ACO0R3_003812 [Hanseniaspora guilliermondii]
MNEAFTFEATLKTTSSQQIFIKSIQSLSQVNKEINILLTPQCMVLSTRNTNFSSALKIEFGRQFFDEWHYKPYLIKHGLEGRSDNWRNYDAELSTNKGNNSERNVSGDCYSFRISALGVLLKNFAFEKGYSVLVNKNGNDKGDDEEEDQEVSNFVDMDNNTISNNTPDKFMNKFFEASRDTEDLINDTEKDVISSIKLILDNTATCPTSRVNKLKITTRSNRGDKLIKTYMPYIIPCFFENYAIEKRYKCRFGNQYLPQLQKVANDGFLAIFKDLVSLYGIDKLEVNLEELNLPNEVREAIKNADRDQLEAKTLIPDREVFEDFENDGIDYSTEDANLFVNYLKSKLSIWKDITDNMNGSSIENLNMKIDTKQLTMRSMTKTINQLNDTLSMNNINSSKTTTNKTNTPGSIDRVTSNFLRDGMSVSNSVPSVQLNNTCLAIGMDHEITFKFKDFKNFLNLIFSASNTQKVQMIALLNYLKNEEYKEGKTGLTSKLNTMSDDLLNFWFADNPGAPIMLEYSMPTVWKSDKIANDKLSSIVNSVKFKLFLLTDYREAQEKLLKQAIDAKERMDEYNNDGYDSGDKKLKVHPLIKLSMDRREQRKTSSPEKVKEELEKGKHLFLDLDEEEINQHNYTAGLSHQEEAYNGEGYGENVDFINESQYHYPSINNNPVEELEFLDDPNGQQEFLDDEGNSYNYDGEELLSRLEREKQNALGDSLLKGFSKFQSRKRQLNEVDNQGGEVDMVNMENDNEVDQLGDVSFNATLDKHEFKGIFEEAELLDRENNEDKRLKRNKSTLLDSEPPVIHYGKKHKGPLAYTEEEVSLGATQNSSEKIVIKKGLLD